MARPAGDHAHLSIGEVLSLLQEEFPDVTISKIRFLESQGLLDPERTPSGYRKFYEADIERLRWILTQQRENFLPLKVIKDRLDEVESGAPPDDPPAGAGGEDGPGTAAAAAEPATGPVAGGRGGGAGGGGDRPAPIWMADAARKAAAKAAPELPLGEKATGGRNGGAAGAAPAAGAGSGGAGPSAGAAKASRGSSPLDVGPTSVSLTRGELCSASQLDETAIQALEDFGLLEGRTVGADVFYDGDALVVAQKAAGFLARGIEARHLRMFKVAAEREAGFLEQVVMPMLKQRNPEARREALEILAELAALGQSLRAAMLRHALRDHLG
jgi:DNA-binding transcriptional MerR regulator